MSNPNNRFNDIHHDFGDDNDENDDEYIDFDNPYRNINKEDEHDPIIINPDDFNMKSSHEIIQEQHLSQKLTQLSTLKKQEQDQPSIATTTTTKRSPLTPTAVTAITKKIKMDNIEKQTENNNIPKYLSSDSQIFDRMIQPILEKTNHTIDIEHLRQIALLKHKIGFINLNIKLWTTYLHSGTGQLLDQITTTITKTRNYPFLTLWPEDVKISMIENHETTAMNPNNINDENCLDYVNKILNEYYDEKMIYKAQSEEKKIEYFNNHFTLDIEETMNKFIEEKGLTLHRLRIEGKIMLVKYDYKDRLIELEFDQENPHQYQKEIFKNLIQAKYEKEKAIYEVATLKQRIAHHFLPKPFDLLQMSLPNSIYKINNEIIRQRLIDRSEKVLQRTKADMIQIYIEIEENKMNEYTTTFNTYMNQMKEDQISAPVHKKLNPTMIDIMNRRFKNIDERLLSHSDDQEELDLVHRRSTNTNNKSIIIGCSPRMTLDTKLHFFSLKQLAFLHRGPSYVTPCLLSSSSSSIFPRNEILTQQMKPLQQQLTKLFTKYQIDLSRRWNFEQEIQKQFIRSFSISIPTYVQQRAYEEKQLIQTISYQIKRDHLILRRTADEQNTYYLGQLDEFNYMTNDYFENLTCYEFISIIDETNNTEQQQLNEMIDSIEFKLNKLLQDRLITKDHLNKIQIGSNKTNITLPYLYFLPNIHKNGHISIETRFSSMNHCPMQSLATYLDQLLRPLFITYSLSTTIINGSDFIEKLQHYCSQGDNLLPLTKFITFQIHNLSTRVSYNDILTGVNRFLHFSITERHHQRLNIDTIEYLIALVLQNNIFTYQRKIYRHTKGCPLNLSLTELLFNIYLQYWQVPLVRLVRLKNIFYGRYHNMGFLTWDGPMDDFDSCIAELNKNHPDIQLTISSNLHVHFLNIDIENRKGNLYTRVYHDPNQQPFLLPYVTGHPRLYHRRWFRFALLRAGQYCCSWNDFNEERLYIELTFLANGYSLDFVEYHLRQFFTRFNPIEKRMNLNQRTYPTFRTKLFQYLNEQKHTVKEQEKLKQHHQLIQLYYLYDWGLRYEFNQKFYELWSTLIEKDPFFKKFNLKIQLHTKHCYPSNILFLHNNKD